MSTNGNTALNLTANGNTQAINMTTGGKLIVASPVQSTPRLIVPAAQLTMVSPEKSPGSLGAVSGARIVSLGGVTLTTPSPVSAVSNIINRAKQNVTSSTPVLLQPANR